MADLPNRDDLEEQLARAIGRVLSSQRKEIIAALGDPPDLANLTAADWERWQAELSAAVGPALQEVYMTQARAELELLPGDVDWGQVNQAAIDWAAGYGFDLVGGVNEASRAALQSAVSAYFEQGWTQRDLINALSESFSPTRASTIARTEVTRAAAEGRRHVKEELATSGIRTVEVWHTRHDEKVCPVCGPCDKMREDEPIHEAPFNDQSWGEYFAGQGIDAPPAHPNCRCSTSLDVVTE